MAVGESAKLFKLIEHYKEHRDDPKQSINFIEFLSLHYNPDSSHEDESHHHEQLPNLHAVAITIWTISQAFVYTSLISLVSYELPESHMAFLNSYHFLFTWDILNPPQ